MTSLPMTLQKQAQKIILNFLVKYHSLYEIGNLKALLFFFNLHKFLILKSLCVTARRSKTFELGIPYGQFKQLKSTIKCSFEDTEKKGFVQYAIINKQS